jgi:hypothetical protein
MPEWQHVRGREEKHLSGVAELREAIASPTPTFGAIGSITKERFLRGRKYR